MKKVGEITDWLKTEYSELNKSNFSVAIDVIVVKQKDGLLKSTPFYVRFGKLSILKPKNTQVYIKINDKIKSLQMRLNETGEAFFIGKQSVNESIKTEENISKKSKEKTIISKIISQRAQSCPIIRNVSNIIEPIVLNANEKFTRNGESENTKINQDDRTNFFLSNDSGDAQANVDDQSETIHSSRQLEHEQLVDLGLEKGINEIKYCVLTSKGEEKVVIGYIFLWNHYEKVVVSDIDGTITRSVLRGQILTIIGHDWYHDHISELLTSIAENGYKILYLSARPFFQCDITRTLLKSIKQDEKTLPWGPLIVNTVGFLDAFHGEIIEKNSDEFKIKILKELCQLFPSNPFYAGFGDKITDVNTYSSIGINDSFIFIVDESGTVNFNIKVKEQLTYKKLIEKMNKLFPVTFI